MITDKITTFIAYVTKEVLPASEDLEKLEDANRKHIQKLVYTNLVDRFDSMVDGAILDNCRSEFLASEATKSMSQQITESDLIQLLMKSEDLQDALDEKLKGALRNTVLRNRHSRKLASLFEAFELSEYGRNAPCVNISTGAILAKIKPQQKTIPYSICGYADWLYSRRNAIVHGAGTNKFLKNDVNQLNKLYKCKPAATFRIKVSSITIAATFYKGVAEILLTGDGENEA